MLRLLVTFGIGYWAGKLVVRHGSWPGAISAVVAQVKAITTTSRTQ